MDGREREVARGGGHYLNKICPFVHADFQRSVGFCLFISLVFDVNALFFVQNDVLPRAIKAMY